jgi:transcriptional regulator with XRE-family HTH domain
MNLPRPSGRSPLDAASRRRAFGAVIQSRRRSRGLPHADLAAAAGIDLEVLDRIEHGTQAITMDEAFALADALGTDLAELLHETRVLAMAAHL